MTQGILVFIIVNHELMIKHAIECIVINWQDYIFIKMKNNGNIINSLDGVGAHVQAPPATLTYEGTRDYKLFGIK